MDSLTRVTTSAVKRLDTLAEAALNEKIRHRGRDDRRRKSADGTESNATRSAPPSDCNMEQASQGSSSGASQGSVSTAGSGAARAALQAKLKTLNVDLSNLRQSTMSKERGDRYKAELLTEIGAVRAELRTKVPATELIAQASVKLAAKQARYSTDKEALRKMMADIQMSQDDVDKRKLRAQKSVDALKERLRDIQQEKEDLHKMAAGDGRRGQNASSSGPNAGDAAAPDTPVVGGDNWEVRGATLKVSAIDSESLKLLLKFASIGSQQATDTMNMFAQELARAQARNAADAGPDGGTLAIPAVGKRKDKGSKGGKGVGKADGPALAILAPGDPLSQPEFCPGTSGTGRCRRPLLGHGRRCG